MRQANQRMIGAIQSYGIVDIPLPAELTEISDAGFVEHDGCVLLRHLAGRCASAMLDSFPDRIGLECFVNAVHVDDYVETHHLATALAFADALLAAWREGGPSLVLNVIVAADEAGANVRCHVARPPGAWLAADLEAYEEAVLTIDSRWTDSAASAGWLGGGGIMHA